jgi:hypothetical protein
VTSELALARMLLREGRDYPTEAPTATCAGRSSARPESLKKEGHCRRAIDCECGKGHDAGQYEQRQIQNSFRVHAAPSTGR